MPKKPRNKKYNRNAAVIRLADKQLRNCFVFFVHELGQNGLRFYLNGRGLRYEEHKHHADTLRLLYELPHHWTMMMGVLCRTPNGKEFIDYTEISTTQRHYYEHLDGIATQYLRGFYEKNNKEHILTSFYIGIPNKGSLSETDIIGMLYEIGANKLNSWYERNLIFNNAVKELSGIPMEKWLSGQTVKVLNKHGIAHFGKIRQIGKEALAKLNGIGEKRLAEIYQRFHDMAVSEADHLPNFFAFQQDEIHRDEVQHYFKRLEQHNEP